MAFAQQSLLWRVTSPKGAVSHLFGTIHLADTMVFRQPAAVLQALDTSVVFIAELDLDSVRAQASNLRAMMAAPGSSLRDVLHDSDYTAVKAYVRTHMDAIAAMSIDLMKPGVIASMMMMQRVKRTAPMSVDEFLWSRAKSLGLLTLGIERAAEQLTVLDAMPPEAIVEFVRNPEAFDSLHGVLRDAYVQGNLDAIMAAMSELDHYESFAVAINDDRNVTMVNRLQEYLQRGGAFVAVGAAHLAGPKGMLALLQSQGYRVTPVTSPERHMMLAHPIESPATGRSRRTAR